MPIASFNGESVKPLPKTIDEIFDEIDADAALQKQVDGTREKIRRIFNPPCEAQEAVEGISDRPQIARPGSAQ